MALAAHQARLYGALQGAYQDLRQTQQTVMQQERLRALGQIASGIAHDINNALSPAALYTQSHARRTRPGLSERSREQLAVIQRAIDDVAQTVQRMRAFYMPRGHGAHAGARGPQPDPHAGDRPHARALEQHAAGARRRRSAWKAISTPDLPKILGAENEMRDALTNLLLNAVDAMPEGGTITLRTRQSTARQRR